MEEILHQLVDSLSHYLQGFRDTNDTRWFAGFLPSKVWVRDCWYPPLQLTVRHLKSRVFGIVPQTAEGPLNRFGGVLEVDRPFCFCRITLEVKKTTLSITLQILDDSNSQFWDDELRNPPSLDGFKVPNLQQTSFSLNRLIFVVKNGLSLDSSPRVFVR